MNLQNLNWNKLKFSLIKEAYKVSPLLEDINGLYSQFKNYLSLDEIYDVISVDPTYNKNNQAGKLSRYLCTIAIDKKKSNQTINTEELRQIAINYLIYNTLLPEIKNKKYTEVIETIRNNNYPIFDNYSDQEIKRLRTIIKAINLGAKLFYHSDKYIVVKLINYDQSKCFDDIAHWCTTNKEDKYNEYKPLFILKNSGIDGIFQFSFNSYMFNDENDKSIETMDLPTDLRELFNNEIKNTPNENKRDVLETQNPNNLFDINLYYFNDLYKYIEKGINFCKICLNLNEHNLCDLISKNESNIKFVYHDIFVIKKIAKYYDSNRLIQYNEEFLPYVNKYSENLYNIIISNEYILHHLNQYIVTDLIEEIIEKHPQILEKSNGLLSYIDNPTREDVIRCLKCNPHQISDIFDEKFLTDKIISYVINKDPTCIFDIIGKVEIKHEFVDLAIKSFISRKENTEQDNIKFKKFLNELRNNGLIDQSLIDKHFKNITNKSSVY